MKTIALSLVCVVGTVLYADAPPPPKKAAQPSAEVLAQRQKLAEAGQRETSPEIATLVKSLSSADPMSRILAIRALAQSRRAEAQSPLLHVLADDKVPEVRETAALSLRVFAGPAVEAGLRAALKDPEERVRVAAAGSLGNFDTAQSAQTLAALVRDPSELMRRNATAGLARQNNPTAVRGLIDALASTDRQVRRIAADGLARSPNADARAALKALMQDSDPTVRAIAQRKVIR